MRYCRITPEGLHSVIDEIENIHLYLEESEPGDVWIIEVVEMTEDEYKSLPEFTGF